MLSRSETIAASALQDLHPGAIRGRQRIRELLERACVLRTTFHRGLNSVADLELGTAIALEERMLTLETQGFDRPTNGQIFLNFSLDERPCFFVTSRCGGGEVGRHLKVRVPDTIYFSERRDRVRRVPDSGRGQPSWLLLRSADGEWHQGAVLDIGPDGFGIEVPREGNFRQRQTVAVRIHDGDDAGSEFRAQIRSVRPSPSRSNWRRVGLLRGDWIDTEPIAIEHGKDLRLRPSDSVASDDPRFDRRILTIRNERQEEIVGILDSFGDVRTAPAVVLPNGWGQTKESLLTLSRTIVATFAEHEQSVQVLRFDGVRKRGESYNDPECRVPGREHHNYVFSQGVSDVLSVVNFLRHDREHRASSIVVVSFSAAALEVRKAISLDAGNMIGGWVSVVGSPDLQSMTRAISGGVDFVGGHERGLQFGLQELLGVTVNIDKIAVDAERHQLSFIQDSRRDMAAIEVPITWFHGKYDAWVALERVRDILSCGDVSRRKLIELETGHQLKSSREAEGAFGAIAQEVSRMALGRALSPVAANARELRRLRVAEQRRLPPLMPQLKDFWRDYLVGRDRSLGIELLTSGEAYKQLMARQIELLELRPKDRVVDLGSGTGAFAQQLFRAGAVPASMEIFCVDHVREALERARFRLSRRGGVPRDSCVAFLESNLDIVTAGQRIPLASGSADAVIASLLLSYLESPQRVLAEIYRLLKPGGRVVLSSLRRDADISRLYVESYAELQVGNASQDLPEFQPQQLGPVARNFLNDAARILELEDSGAFHFWDADELAGIAEDAGFRVAHTGFSLGVPPQAIVVSATRG